SELEHLARHEDASLAIDAQHETRRPSDLVALTDRARERKRRTPSEEPASEVGTGGAGGRVLDGRAPAREEDAGAELARRRSGEHVGAEAVPADPPEPLQERADRLAARHGVRGPQGDHELVASGVDPARAVEHLVAGNSEHLGQLRAPGIDAAKAGRV